MKKIIILIWVLFIIGCNQVTEIPVVETQKVVLPVDVVQEEVIEEIEPVVEEIEVIVKPEWYQPNPGETWQWQLSDEVNTDYNVDMYDIDLYDVSDETIEELNSKGVNTICYISVGSWEDWREDKDEFPKSVIGKNYGGWPGEKFIDIRSEKVRNIMKSRLDLCKERGFKGIEPDNMDVYGEGDNSGFPLTEDDGVEFAIWLAKEAHKRGLSIGHKNAPEIANEVYEYYDWALTEDCFDEGWCDEMKVYTDNNKAVFMTEYTDRTSSSKFQNRACEWKEKGFSPLLKDRMLTEEFEVCY